MSREKSSLVRGFPSQGFLHPPQRGGGPLERKCKKEESAQKGVWGEIPETTHALKERDSRKDRVGKGGEGDPGKGKKRSSLREKSRRTSRTGTYSCGDVFASDGGGAGDTCLLLLSLASLGAWNARGAGIEPRPKGLRMRTSLMCTLSQNGYGEHLWASGRLDPPDPLGSARSRCRCQGARSTRGGAGLTGAAGGGAPCPCPQVSRLRSTGRPYFHRFPPRVSPRQMSHNSPPSSVGRAQGP